MATLDSVGVVSSAKLLTSLGALVGLIAGILYSFGGAIIDALVSLGRVTTTETPGLSWGTVLAFGALMGMPVIGSAGGFVAGVTGAVLYNLVAKRVGGIEMQFEE